MNFKNIRKNTRIGRNTVIGQRERAFAAGCATGFAGNENASPPYLHSAFTEQLILEWKRGYEQGLAAWRAEWLDAKRKALEAERLTRSGMSLVKKAGQP